MANGFNENNRYNNFGLNVFKAPEKKRYWQPPLKFRHSLGSSSL